MLQDVLPIALHIRHILMPCSYAFAWVQHISWSYLLACLLVFDLCHIRYGKNQRPTSSGNGQSSIHDDRFENVQIFSSFCSMCFDKMYDFHVAEILRRWNNIFFGQEATTHIFRVLCITYCPDRFFAVCSPFSFGLMQQLFNRIYRSNINNSNLWMENVVVVARKG